MLGGLPALLELPTDRARPAVQDYAGASIEVRLTEDLTGSEEAEPPLWNDIVYDAAGGWAALLSRLSDRQEVVVGTPTANRTRVEVEG